MNVVVMSEDCYSISVRFVSAEMSVRSSAYSMSDPVARPRTMRVSLILFSAHISLRRCLRKRAVMSPSVVKFVAIITSFMLLVCNLLSSCVIFRWSPFLPSTVPPRT